jgi:hypothetical protein
MSTPPLPPLAQAMLAWMSRSQDRLQDLLDEESGGDRVVSPVSDEAIRAHLRYVGESLSATADPRDAGITGFGGRLPALFAEREALLAETIAVLGEAHAFEAGKQFGQVAGEDPSNRQVLDRRVRLNAWIRVFLDSLDAARAGEPPVAPEANRWMAERQEHLANAIFAIDRQAKQALIARRGAEALSDPETVNLVGQAALVQAHTRFLVEALSETLPGPAA